MAKLHKNDAASWYVSVHNSTVTIGCVHNDH